ncbi:MAG: NAD+ synthase [Planctomycetota bacterium]
MKIALAQINPTVGDVAGNTEKIAEAIARAGDARARLVVCPEMAVLGYPPKDLLLKPAVLERCSEAVQGLAERCVDGVAAVIGLPVRSDKPSGRSLYNAAAVCDQGRVVHTHLKSLLPTYDVFDEQRYFEPGPGLDLTELPLTPNGDAAVRLGISVCEDLWNDGRFFSRQLYHDNPIDQLAGLGAQLFVNCSASPYTVRKHGFRLRLMSGVARKHRIPLVYCNQVGGNDGLVFDGCSCVFDATGTLLAHAKAFDEDLLIVDVPLETPAADHTDSAENTNGHFDIETTTSTNGNGHTTQAPITRVAPNVTIPNHATALLPSAYHALVLGLRDYCRKCGFQSVALGLSGGIDSAVTAAIAVDALGPDQVIGVAMPSRYSSDGSKSDAEALADATGLRFHTVPIESAHAAYEALLPTVLGGDPKGLTEENLQARLRGVLMMSVSNDTGALLLTTGNKSELAVGYCTLYGDMCGGLAVLSDVPKTMVYDLARWINTPDCPLYQRFNGPVIPADSISKAPSAELRADQLDEDSLPPYDVLDQIVERYVEREQSADVITQETGFDAALVLQMVRLIDRNEYKRRQAAPGLKITGRAFGFGRRMPIAQRWDHQAATPRTSPTASS